MNDTLKIINAIIVIAVVVGPPVVALVSVSKPDSLDIAIVLVLCILWFAFLCEMSGRWKKPLQTGFAGRQNAMILRARGVKQDAVAVTGRLDLLRSDLGATSWDSTRARSRPFTKSTPRGADWRGQLIPTLAGPTHR